MALVTVLSSLLAYCNKSPRLIWKIVVVFGSAGTISHFGKRFREGQYILASFFICPTLPSMPSHL